MSNDEDRRFNARVAFLIDALAQAISGCSKAIKISRELRKNDGLSISKMTIDVESICTQLDQQLRIARSLLK
jgi:hypothetical protein